MLRPKAPPVYRFATLDQLCEALSTHAIPAVRSGGVVRVNPLLFAEGGIAHLLEARRRVGTYGLVLVMTFAVQIDRVELQCGRPL
jgi:hypothetical protein